MVQRLLSVFSFSQLCFHGSAKPYTNIKRGTPGRRKGKSGDERLAPAAVCKSFEFMLKGHFLKNHPLIKLFDLVKMCITHQKTCQKQNTRFLVPLRLSFRHTGPNSCCLFSTTTSAAGLLLLDTPASLLRCRWAFLAAV